jgi:hypothetical protein
MQNNGSILYDYQLKHTGRRHIRRQRTYTLEQAITPKTCGLLPGSSRIEQGNFSEIKTNRLLFIAGGLLFAAIGLYSIIF